MSENNYDEDMFFSKKYRYLLQILYKQYYYDGRYVFVDKSRFSTLVQKRLKTDVIAQTDEESSCGIEEKVARWPELKNEPHTAFFLETESCTNPGNESPGWMRDGQADYLLYAFEIKGLGLDVYIMPFQELKAWFWPFIEKNPNKFFTFTNQNKNRTRGRLANITVVIRAVPTVRYLITFDGTCKPLDLSVNILSLFHTRKDTNRVEIDIHDRVEIDIHDDEEWENNWQEVQERVEEILAQQEVEQILLWQEEVESKENERKKASPKKRRKGKESA